MIELTRESLRAVFLREAEIGAFVTKRECRPKSASTRCGGGWPISLSTSSTNARA